MEHDPEQARKWRLRAEELRARADATDDPVARESFLRLARQWEAKADKAEREPWRAGSPKIAVPDDEGQS